MGQAEEFQKTAIRAFDFLVREFGCAIERNVNRGGEAYVIFKCGDLKVTVNYALGDEPWVTVKPSGETKETSLKKLLQRSGIQSERTSNESLKGLVARQAEMLRTWLITTKQPRESG